MTHLYHTHSMQPYVKVILTGRRRKLSLVFPGAPLSLWASIILQQTRSKHCSGCRHWAHCIVGSQQWVLLTLHIMWPALKPVAAPVSLLEPIMQLVWVIYSYGCIELSVFSLERKWIALGFEIDSALLKSSFFVNVYSSLNQSIFPPTN